MWTRAYLSEGPPIILHSEWPPIILQHTLAPGQCLKCKALFGIVSVTRENRWGEARRRKFEPDIPLKISSHPPSCMHRTLVMGFKPRSYSNAWSTSQVSIIGIVHDREINTWLVSERTSVFKIHQHLIGADKQTYPVIARRGHHL